MGASESYLKKAPPLKHPKDLTGHACIRYVAPPADDFWFLRSKQGKTAKVLPPFTVSANTFPAIKALALRGHGIALLPSSVFHMEVAEKKLVRVLPDWATPEDPLHLVYPAQRFASPKLREFLPILQQELRDLAGSASREE